MGLLKRENINIDNKPTRYFSSKQEKKVAKNLNGKVQKNSGATPYQKGDVSLEKYLIECKTKTTHSESINIKKEWLEKLDREALFMGKPNSALIFNFGLDEKNYVIISEDLFKELIDNG